jgi:hypothetical protein
MGQQKTSHKKQAKSVRARADDQISEALAPRLLQLYGDSDAELRAHLTRFRRAHCRQLQFIVVHHAEDPRVAPLLRQPELPLILDRLEVDPYGLLESWPESVPRMWLEALAEAWGNPL